MVPVCSCKDSNSGRVLALLSLTVSNFGSSGATFGRKVAAELARQSFVEIFGISPRRRGGGDNGAASVSLWGPCWVLGSTERRARSWPGPISRRVDDSAPLIRPVAVNGASVCWVNGASKVNIGMHVRVLRFFTPFSICVSLFFLTITAETPTAALRRSCTSLSLSLCLSPRHWLGTSICSASPRTLALPLPPQPPPAQPPPAQPPAPSLPRMALPSQPPPPSLCCGIPTVTPKRTAAPFQTMSTRQRARHFARVSHAPLFKCHTPRLPECHTPLLP